MTAWLSNQGRSRLAILRLMQGDNRPRTALEIARAIGTYRELIYAALTIMERQKEVERFAARSALGRSERMTGGRPINVIWTATAAGLRVDLEAEAARLSGRPAPAAQTRESRYDHRALSEAFSMADANRSSPDELTSRVHSLKDAK